VLEPFADELGLGQDEGGAEAASLRSAGFAVDQAYNEQADMRLMQSLPAYSVVYMLTHSGVNAEGEGVIATGQVANPDPSVQPLLDDRTVMVVGVVGTSQKYYGILSGYFMRHSSAFPAGSLWFVNGCSMLRASLVWNALAYRGVRAMVSWDNEAMANDDATAAQIFYQSLAAGRTVSQSLGDVFAAGHGRSLVGVTTAQLGYLGDAGFTLHDVQFPPPPTSTAPPTATSTPVPAAPPASPTPSPHLRHPWPAPLPWKTAVRLRPS
jgi:hypothetical protein